MLLPDAPLVALLLLLAAPARALSDGQDWPTFRADPARSARSAAPLDARRLVPSFTFRSQAPRPAWPGPARWDAFAKLEGLGSMREYDPVFHPVAVADAVYFGSSADDSVVRIDVESGEVDWRFFTDGPVRVAPTYDDGKLYFGSDDGRAYCLDAATGEELWRFAAVPDAARFLNDGRVISTFPVRTGVLVMDGVAYLGASMFPWEPSYVCALDARSGALEGAHARRPTFVRELGPGYSLEGALLGSSRDLILPQGRVAPLVFGRDDGASRGMLAGGGGSFVLLTADERVLHGPGNKQGWITDSSAETREQLASFDGGRAVVVDDERAYLLTERDLSGLERESRALAWRVPCATPHALILAGGALFLGGDDVVEARSCADGSLLWRAPVEGRAKGLAAARGRLFVATDEGRLHAFVQGEATAELPEDPLAAAALSAPPAPPPIPALRDRALLDRWVFQRDALEERPAGGDDPRVLWSVRNQARGHAARAEGALELEQTGALQALVLDGTSSGLLAAESITDARLPKRAMSAEAWVRVDRPMEWGGLLGATQDNGDYERGWILGFRGSQFAFALKAERGPGNLTWLRAEGAFTPRSWHHVVGTYDGKQQRVYVDGELAGESDAQRGDLDYPERAYYALGAYRDDDEHFRAEGAVQELCLYERALSARDVKQRWEAKRGAFPPPPEPEPVFDPTLELTRGPIMRFVRPGTAEVEWELAGHPDAELVIEAPVGDLRARLVSKDGARAVSRIESLPANHVARFRFEAGTDGAALRSRDYECDTHFDRRVDPISTLLPGDPFAFAAFPEVPYVVLLGSGQAIQLALATDARVLVLVRGLELARAARAALHRVGGYGSRVAVLDVGEAGALRLPRAFANLVIATPDADQTVANLVARGALELVRPDGGRALLYDPPPVEHSLRAVDPPREPFPIELERGPLAGAGAWTHMYGRADNSAFGGEALAGARSTGELVVQWAGRPGPRHQSDRQNRKPAPLAVNGRLFVQGLERISALDAYNGELLWTVGLPELRRFNVPRSSSNWCADEERVYVAMRDRVEVFEASTGRITATHALGSADQEWGYVARVGDVLLGSAARAGSHFTGFWGGDSWYDAKAGENAAKVCSDALFALDPASGARRWTYSRGLVIEPTITADDERVWFVECRDPAARALETRRLNGPELWEDLHLVCLDLATGKRRFQRPIEPMPGEVAFYLALSDERLVLLSSAGGQFAVYVLDAKDGSSEWRKKFAWEVDHHGKHLSRPALVGGKLFVRPLAFELASGDELALPFPGGHQCGTYVATEEALFLRAGELCAWDLEGGGATRWSRLRPDCWISTIPACGMLLSPEGGGGCSCGSWLETSIGFLPRAAEDAR